MMDLVGLVFIDWLRLTPGQWAALGFHAAGWLWWFRYAHPERERHAVQIIIPACVLFSALWIAFWNEMTCVDQWMLFEEAQDLSRFEWHAFLDHLLNRLYVDTQPPFFTFWMSRLPLLWAHQLLWFPWALLCAGLMWQLYGRAAALLLATPVVALMIHQPSQDTLLFGMLLIVLRLCQLSPGVQSGLCSGISDSTVFQRLCCPPQIVLAAFVYGLTWMVKPLTILTVPFILPQLGVAGLLSLAMWGGYVLWSLQWEFGREQFRFLLHQLMIRSMPQSSTTSSVQAPLTFQRFLKRLVGTLGWRWKHLGHKAVKALPLYLFPTYLQGWNWKGIALTAIIVIGYGNIKYLLIAFLFVFPIKTEEESVL